MRRIVSIAFVAAAFVAGALPARAGDSTGPDCTDIVGGAALYTDHPVLAAPDPAPSWLAVPGSTTQFEGDLRFAAAACTGVVYSITVYDPTQTVVIGSATINPHGWTDADGNGVEPFVVPVTGFWTDACIHFETRSQDGSSVYDTAPNVDEGLCYDFALNVSPNYTFH